MISKEEFLKRVREDEEYAPGWDAIENAFTEIYSGRKPDHYGTRMQKRAWMGGDEYLDGYSFYKSEKGYLHLVSFGMTILYGDEEKYGEEYNGWGYEMTMKLARDNPQSCMWAVSIMSSLAKFTFQSGNYLSPHKFIGFGGKPLNGDDNSLITGVLTVYDTELNTQDTVYGKTEFIQLVGITESELKAIRESRDNIDKLINAMKRDGNNDLVTDINRKKTYL